MNKSAKTGKSRGVSLGFNGETFGEFRLRKNRSDTDAGIGGTSESLGRCEIADCVEYQFRGL